MPPNLACEIAALPRLRVAELRAQFATIFGEPTPSHNKVWLVRRIAWRLQAQAEGDLSERARQRAAALVADADLRLSAPSAQATTATPEQPPNLRLPIAGGRLPDDFHGSACSRSSTRAERSCSALSISELY